MTTRKMPKMPIDDQLSTRWGLAALKSVGVSIVGVIGANLRAFDLINMETYRAHVMTIGDGSGSFGLPVSVSLLNSDYSYFNTSRPANFSDFDGSYAEVGTVDIGIYSWSEVKIFDGMKILGRVKSSGFGLATPEVGSSMGLATVHYGDGRPKETPSYETRINIPVIESPNGEYKVKQNADSIAIRLKGDVLFDFDRDLLHYQATDTLSKVIKFINSTSGYTRIVIEGHTDSRERVPGHNLNLSRRRALAVKNYFEKHSEYFDRKYIFSTAGFGATKPVAPNKKPDGSDDPIGREKNRRVEIFLLKK